MSNQYDNTNRGTLFRNDDKANERHADYRGQINVGGTEYWLDAWLKKSKAGAMYMSLSVKPKLAREHKGAPANPPAQTQDDGFFDDIPF